MGSLFKMEPNPILHTDLLLIDEGMDDGDFERLAEELYDVIDRNREHLSNLVWAEGATLESTRIYLDSAKYSSEILHVMMVNDRPAGLITLRQMQGRWLLGYWLDERWCGRGLMKTFVQGVIYRARVFLGVSDPIRACIRHKNIASQAIVLAASFKLVDSDGEWNIYEQETSPDLYA